MTALDLRAQFFAGSGGGAMSFICGAGDTWEEKSAATFAFVEFVAAMSARN